MRRLRHGRDTPSRPERFEPPLLFDLDDDPQEARPLDPAAHALLLLTVARLRAAKEADINASFRSVTRYTGDIGEIHGRCRGDTGSFRSVTCHASLGPARALVLSSDPIPSPSPNCDRPEGDVPYPVPNLDLCHEP